MEGSLPVILSAKTPGALQEMLRRWGKQIASHNSLADIAWTAAVSRSDFTCRIAFIAENTQQLLTLIKRAAEGEKDDAIIRQGDISHQW
ncbi:hypothetical protein, partial [Xenorhabdus bovienii]